MGAKLHSCGPSLTGEQLVNTSQVSLFECACAYKRVFLTCCCPGGANLLAHTFSSGDSKRRQGIGSLKQRWAQTTGGVAYDTINSGRKHSGSRKNTRSPHDEAAVTSTTAAGGGRR